MTRPGEEPIARTDSDLPIPGLHKPPGLVSVSLETAESILDPQSKFDERKAGEDLTKQLEELSKSK